LTPVAIRQFGGGHGHHDDHHDDHGHHQHVDKPAPDHKFIAKCNKKFLVFDGLRATDPAVVEVINPYRHHNDLTLFK
jgi:hypothetical protein